MLVLNIGTELDQLFLLASVILWLCTIVFVFLPQRKNLPRFLFAAYLLLPSYLHWELFLSGGNALSPEAIFDTWFRHISFFAGQLLFFLFVTRYFSTGTHRAHPFKNGTATLTAMGSVDIASLPLTPHNMLLYLTDQGVQHILVTLFFFVTAAVARTQSLIPNTEARRRVIGWFFLASGAFSAIHIWEYISETLGLFPFLSEETIECVEYALQFVGLLLFFPAMKKLKNVSG